MHANSTDTTSTPYRTHMSPSQGTRIVILPIGVSPGLHFLHLNTLLIPHYSRYEDSVLCLARFDAHGVNYLPWQLVTTRRCRVCVCTLLRTQGQSCNPGQTQTLGVHGRKHARLAAGRWPLAAYKTANATTLAGGINSPGKLSSVGTLEICEMEIQDGYSIFWGRGDQGSCDRSDLLSTDSILCTSNSAREDRNEACPRSHQDGSHGYNSHRKVPKERQIIKKDGSYDIDPGKSPTKASSR
ncbi:hypothetical protein GB937_007424 [Aspergillus fischeri]|nr:hypothetical protein GB937_007424 [Aspergillus fischeri]